MVMKDFDPELIYQIIGQRVRKFRLEKKLTQEKLSELADISLSFLGHIERGTRKMSVDTLLKLANALDVSPNDLTDYLDQQSFNDAQELLEYAAKLFDRRKRQMDKTPKL